jgi:epoxide hydrolase-like predicted phosphatase
MSIRAIIWDFEGVILLNPYGNPVMNIAHRLDIPVERLYKAFDAEFMDRVDKGEFTQEASWNHLLDALCLPRSDIKHLNDVFYKDFFVDQEMVTDIQGYRKQFKTALLSNYSDALRPMLANRWRMDGAFDEIIISCEVHLTKPNAAIYQHALQRLGTAPQETIFFDDREVNITGAQALGIHAFQYTGRAEMNRRIQEVIALEE